MNEKIRDIWDKIRTGATLASELATKTAENAGEKAKDVYNASKTNFKIFDLKTDIELLYKELGRAIYVAHSGEETSEEEIDNYLAVIDEKMAQIESLKEELESSRAKKECPDCGKENEAGAAFCSACGAKLED